MADLGAASARLRLNNICPYFTMFPLDFPLGMLTQTESSPGTTGWVLDPFCGRGTTNFAARIQGLPSAGIDVSPIGVALSRAKMVTVAVEEIVETADAMLKETLRGEVPRGDFWSLAYDAQVLESLCTLRDGLLLDCSSDARVALRAVVLGALHGPLNKRDPSYFSNQAPRTFAPKPAYSVSYWHRQGLLPPKVDVLGVIRKRSRWYYGYPVPETRHLILHRDSRDPRIVKALRQACEEDAPFAWVITSPPYFGMVTYIPDQWLRNWFLGGPAHVDYSAGHQIGRNTVERYVHDLRRVWINVAEVCRPGARMVLRFGRLNSMDIDVQNVLGNSFHRTPWFIDAVLPAGNSRNGKRQADFFSSCNSYPAEEADVYCILAA